MTDLKSLGNFCKYGRVSMFRRFQSATLWLRGALFKNRLYLYPRGGHNGRRLVLWISQRLLNVELFPRGYVWVFSGFLKGQPQPEHVPDDPKAPVHVVGCVPPDNLRKETVKKKLAKIIVYIEEIMQWLVSTQIIKKKYWCCTRFITPCRFQVYN